MKFIALLFLVVVALSSSLATKCEDYKKDEKKCLSTIEDGIACAFCSSAAVGTTCTKETDAKTLPASVFECEYKSSSLSGSQGNETLSTSTYSKSAAVDYGDSYCAKDSDWLCAEFVSRALHAGGLFEGVSDYGSYKGYNLRSVTDLHKALKKLYSWTESSSGTNCGSKGEVLIYNGDEHAALAIGSCLLDQHNPSRCGTNAAWGTNVVLKSP